jgi:succinoglycan biosynthesis protein ExoO
MSERADVAVIMANYNGSRYIAAAIRSVIRQTLTSWELIVVDDASTDDSLAAATEAAADDPRIRIIAQPTNKGPGAARNRALDLVKARWIAILDNDDLMPPQRLEYLLRRAHIAGAAIIADNLMEFSATSRPRSFLPERLRREASWIPLATFIHSNCLYSRTPPLGYLKPLISTEIMRDLDLHYDETLHIGEDYYLLAYLMAHGYRLLLEPASVYFYRKHEKSVSHRLRTDDIIAQIAAEERFVRSGLSFPPQVEASLKRRQRTLRALLVYDTVITASKQRDFLRAVDCAATHPYMWPLLIQPINARLSRLTKHIRIWGRASEGTDIEKLMLGAAEPAK